MATTECVPLLAHPPVDSVQILGSRVHLASAAETADRIETWIEASDGRCRRVVVTGFHGLWAAYKNPTLSSILNSADLWVPDGIAPVWAARLRGYRQVERAPGADIMRAFLARANRKGFSSFFYGDTDATLASLRRRLGHDFPGHRIAGSYSPPFRPLTPAEDAEIVDRINRARPDVLWVGLGMPKQDIWIHDHIDQLRVPVAIGVGAAFAFVAGTVARCPDWMGRLGFEWVYRFAREPKKLWRRDILDGPRFVYHVGLELLREKGSMTQTSSQTD